MCSRPEPAARAATLALAKNDVISKNSCLSHSPDGHYGSSVTGSFNASALCTPRPRGSGQADPVMDAILSEISHKRKDLATPGASGSAPASKYMRRADIERAKEEERRRVKREEEEKRATEKREQADEKVGAESGRSGGTRDRDRARLPP